VSPTLAELHNILRNDWNSIATNALFDVGPLPQPFLEVLPLDYLNAAREFGGREGYLGTEYLRLHRLEELAALNNAYDVPSAVPEVVIFGSDGALEAYAFTLLEFAIVKIPFIPLLFENAQFVAGSFSDFIAIMHDTGPSLNADPASLGMQIHSKHPIALGGSPTDAENRVLVPPQKHAEIARYWNTVYNHARFKNARKA
jgi:hypothetical protein